MTTAPSAAAREACAARMAAWIATREPAPPASLAARIGSLYAESCAAGDDAAVAADGPPTAERCARAAAVAVGELIASGATTRASALDLLAADALATYAFELASERPEELGALAEATMRRCAALAAPHRRS